MRSGGRPVVARLDRWPGQLVNPCCDCRCGAVGELDVGFGPGRNGQHQVAAVVIDLPGDLDAAVRRVMVGARTCDAATRLGPDTEPAVPRLEDLEAGDVLVEERDDRALAVVVQRCVGVAVGVDAAPLLPHRGGATVDHDEPRGLGVLEQQVVGDVEVAAVGEDREEERGGEKPRAEVVSGVPDEPDQAIGGGGS